MNRLDRIAKDLSQHGEGQLGVVCPPSMPPYDFTLDFVEMAVEAGVDMVFAPFSSPEVRRPWMMGPTEQMADKAALGQGITADMCFDCMEKIRVRYPDLPMLVVSFESDVFCYGQERFIRRCIQAGIDGIDTPGYSYVRSRDVTGFGKLLKDVNIHLIHPISIELAMSREGSMENEILKGIIKAAGGFVFLMANSAGKGGGQEGFPVAPLKAAAARIREYQHKINNVCPIITVCGIYSPEVSGAAYRDVLSDGVLVSSAIIRLLNANESLENVGAFIKSLKDSMRRYP